jgi:hypothetical protein
MRICRNKFILLTLVLSPLSSGCGGSTRAQLRNYDPPAATAKAMELNDPNGDGKIAGDELTQCPALSVSMRRIDTDRDGALSRDELQARFEAIDAQSDMVAVSVRVTLKDRPLPGAKVTLTPAPFMGEGLQDHAGTTDSEGGCLLAGSVVELPGIPAGFYHARIVHEGSNIDTVRGCEIADDASGNRLLLSL